MHAVAADLGVWGELAERGLSVIHEPMSFRFVFAPIDVGWRY